MKTPHVLAFAGSTRSGSFNKLLVEIAAQGARDAGARVTLIDLRDYPMPLYDGDLESSEGIPQPALALKKQFLEHQGMLIASPEYNGSISAVLKNAIDWASRQAPNESPLQCFRGKIVGLLGASPGLLGGMRGLLHLRTVMGGIGCIVLPDQLTVNAAHEAFDEEGRLLDKARDQRARAVGASVSQMTMRLTGEHRSS
jgi:NAD(P)H-dependent FMN reductase